MLSEAKIEYAFELQTVPQPQRSSLQCVPIRIFLIILDKLSYDAWHGQAGERFIFTVGCLTQQLIYYGIEVHFGVEISAVLTFFFSFVHFHRSVWCLFFGQKHWKYIWRNKYVHFYCNCDVHMYLYLMVLCALLYVTFLGVCTSWRFMKCDSFFLLRTVPVEAQTAMRKTRPRY